MCVFCCPNPVEMCYYGRAASIEKCESALGVLIKNREDHGKRDHNKRQDHVYPDL